MQRSFRLFGVLVVLMVMMLATNGYADHAKFYVLDGFGGVHAGGGAPAPPAGIPYFGFDIAKDIAYIPSDGVTGTGSGVMVLDGFGGIHVAGISGVAPLTPYFGFDVARALVYRNIPPRAAGVADASIIDLSVASTSYTVLESFSISAPDDGYLLVIGSSYISCANGAAGSTLSAYLAINVDATAEPTALAGMGRATFDDCANIVGFPTDNQTVVNLFPVAAGAHTVNLLGRRHTSGNTTGSARFLGRSLSAVFVDHGSVGIGAPQSQPDASVLGDHQ